MNRRDNEELKHTNKISSYTFHITVTLMEKKEIEKLAFLARIKLDEEELSNVPGELESILGYVQKLNDVDTRETEPLFHFSELKNVVREDKAETIDKDTQKEMMRMGKDKDDYLKVESIL